MFKENLKKNLENKIFNAKHNLQICKENSLNEEYFLGYLQALESVYELIK